MKTSKSSNNKTRCMRPRLIPLDYKHSCNESTCSYYCLRRFLTTERGPIPANYRKPYPISTKITDKICDPLLHLVQRKLDFESKIESIRSSFKLYEKRMHLSKQFKCFQDMQEALTHEPDKYFCSNYNWYYTGGNLMIEKINDINILFHITDSKELNASRLTKEQSGWTSKHLAVLSKHTSEIYQLDTSNRNDESILVAIRRKNKILLFHLIVKDDEKFKYKGFITDTEEVPFVSMCLNKHNYRDYVTANVEKLLKIRDLDTLKTVYEYKVPHDIIEAGESDCFAQVAYCNDNILAYINRCNFYNFDKRASFNSNCFHMTYNSFLDFEDRFVSIFPQKDNLCYINTFKDILLFDLRNRKVRNKYSHSFVSAPFISDLMYNSDNDLYFCISSCKPDEKLLLEREGDINYPPVSLPTLTEAFESSCLVEGSNIDMCLKNKNRLDVSTTGIKLWKDVGACAVFSANVLGDVYCHEFTLMDDYSREMHFQKWNNNLIEYESGKNNMNVTDKVILHDIPCNFNSSPPDCANMIKIKRLQDCTTDLKKDAEIKAKVGNVWETVLEPSELVAMEEMSPDITVRNWLNTLNFDFDPPLEECDSHKET